MLHNVKTPVFIIKYHLFRNHSAIVINGQGFLVYFFGEKPGGHTPAKSQRLIVSLIRSATALLTFSK